jgi:Holliday junction resolvase RusA-like endonuclease
VSAAAAHALPTELYLTVYGRPQPAGSKRAFQHATTRRVMVTDANPNSRPWKQQVTAQALHQLNGQPILLQGPLELTVTFILARPKSHYRTGRNQHLLRPAAPARPTTKPDTTKLLRGVEDALTGIYWNDDAQIVDQHAHKEFGAPERVEIIVRRAP